LLLAVDADEEPAIESGEGNVACRRVPDAAPVTDPLTTDPDSGKVEVSDGTRG